MLFFMCGTISLQDVAASEYYERRTLLWVKNFINLEPIIYQKANTAKLVLVAARYLMRAK